MSDNSSIIGEVLEKAGTPAKQTGKAAAAAASDFAQGAASQVGVPVPDSSGNVPQSVDSVNTQDVVESLYGKSQTQTPAPHQSVQSGDAPADTSKSPEELAEIEVVRKRLHNEYYQSLVNPPKQEEERVAEKVEREEKEEMVDLQQKEMKKPPPLVQRQAQRVEKFPGASG